ncbi:ribosomal RNA processing protein [Crepidotus variabilis]|uniref:Ribosomal RNA processing protein n=1 Tax=Crepidotus variabilis TaxID=179855 RepID=A0A9P6EUD2_9AGAR|nr:ribosomal RNA processing protein [Crepidotus variabilis]
MSTSAGPPLGKYLASTDKKTRDKAIKNLSAFLSEDQDGLPKSEMDKLWKGIFYCFWMSDKPLVQQALAAELAELLLTITSTQASLAFLKSFWQCTVREWNGIDRLRIDKYYMLIRKFVNATFRLLIRANWEEKAFKEYNGFMTQEGGPLCSVDIKVPTSLSYHIADIYLEELEKTLKSSPECLPVPLSTVIDPFFSLAAQTPTSIAFKRIQTAVFDPLFSALEPSIPSDTKDQPRKSKRIKLSNEPSYPNVVSNSCYEDSRTEGKVSGSLLKRKLLKRMFAVAGQTNTKDSSRRKMYGIWKEWYIEEDGE